MAREGARARTMQDTRQRILDVARELLGQHPDAGMGDVAAAAGVVRRTVYGHFPSRNDLVRTLAAQAAAEIVDVLEDVNRDQPPADAVWAQFVHRLWPLADRYRVLLVLRRGEHGDEIHAALGSVDNALADLMRRGQEAGAFGHHLPPDILAQIGYAVVFAIADHSRGHPPLDATAAAITSMLVLGVPEARAHQLAAPQR